MTLGLNPAQGQAPLKSFDAVDGVVIGSSIVPLKGRDSFNVLWFSDLDEGTVDPSYTSW